MRKNLSLSDSGLHIIDPDAADKLQNKVISASLITALLDGCHARWVFETYSGMPDGDVDTPRTRGSWFHYIMEQFFALPPKERTRSKLLEIAKDTRNHPDFTELYRVKEARSWLQDCLKGLYEAGSRPERVDIVDDFKQTKWDGSTYTKPGLEVLVKGHIGNAKRPVLGFIDQLSRSGKDRQGVQVLDWKTGSTAKRFNKNTKRNDGWAEARQQILYTLLLRDLGHRVDKAGLVFPVAREVVMVPVNDKELIARAVDDVEQTDKILDDVIVSNEFGFQPSFLCSWCPLAKLCPKAQRGRSEKMTKAWDSQPEPEELSEYLQID